jgi:diguanylate cyclase (GGDEF)-like protein
MCFSLASPRCIEKDYWDVQAEVDFPESRQRNYQSEEEPMLNKIEPMEIRPECALPGIHLEAATRRNTVSLDKLETLLDICEHAIISEDLGEFLDKATEIIHDSCNYDLVQIWTVGSRAEELLLSSSVPPVQKEPIVGRAITSVMEEAKRKSSISQDKERSSQSDHDLPKRVPSAQCTIPLRHHGKLLGLLLVESKQFKTFPAEQSALLENISTVIAAALDKFKAIARSNRSYEYLRVILNSASNLAILSTDVQGYVFAGSSGIETVFQMPTQSILGCDILTLFTDEEFRRELALYMAGGGADVFSKNKLVQETDKGKLYLDVSFQRMNPIEDNHLGFLCLATDVTANALLEQKLQTLSVTDELTGLSNRRNLMAVLSSEINRSRRFNHTFSLCFFDLDGFKQYNDSRGHLSGDKALVTTADLLRAHTRINVDSCYRFGGDELAILMPETSAQKAARSVERILALLCESFNGAITASCGIAEFKPTLQAESLMEAADRAMYKAKTNGGNQIVISR